MGGSILSPEGFFPKLSPFCEEWEILVGADEVLTGMGRAAKCLCEEHWMTRPDVVTVG